MVRASDIVKGKLMRLGDIETKDTSTEDTVSKDVLLEEARMSLRLSEIDVLKLKSGKQQEMPVAVETQENLDVETQPTAANIKIVAPSYPLATTIQILQESQGEEPVAVISEGQPEKDEIRRIYLAAKQYMLHVREKVIKGESFQLEPALSFIDNILHSSQYMVSQIYQLTVDYEQEDDYYLSSPVNTLVYGLEIAQRMGYSKSEIIEFGLAAMLHDVGMFMIPDQILNKQGKLSDDEMELIKLHPDFAVAIMEPFAAIYPKMIKAIYQHQERANGQGYPLGLKGNEICDYAQIIGICDSYEAMTHHRPHKKQILQFESIKRLIDSKSNLFEPRIIKTFVDEISIYPIGSYVRLNNRNIGRVVAINKGYPMKPMIDVIFDEKGNKIKPSRIIDLKNYPILNINATISIDDLPDG